MNCDEDTGFAPDTQAAAREQAADFSLGRGAREWVWIRERPVGRGRSNLPLRCSNTRSCSRDGGDVVLQCHPGPACVRIFDSGRGLSLDSRRVAAITLLDYFLCARSASRSPRQTCGRSTCRSSSAPIAISISRFFRTRMASGAGARPGYRDSSFSSRELRYPTFPNAPRMTKARGRCRCALLGAVDHDDEKIVGNAFRFGAQHPREIRSVFPSCPNSRVRPKSPVLLSCSPSRSKLRPLQPRMPVVTRC